MLTALLLASAIDTAILPPVIPWDGPSRRLVVAADDPWITPSERGQLRTTPDYDETVAYLRRLVAAAKELQMVSLGRSAEGRDIWLVIASKERAFTPDALRRTNKPVVFAQAGIHAGEIDGKDAGLMLLRDMTVRATKRDLLDRANFLFVPIFNTDGHERSSRFSRINQRGPEESGWRTTAQNYNLNRDYMKADTPEMAAMLRAIDTWQPDLYIDLHVTDGADYQYDLTYGGNVASGWSPAIAGWMTGTFRPAIDAALKEMGHIPGPLIFTDDPAAGIGDDPDDPRLSSGYGDARHMATILVENHSLKPYDQRVLATYVFLEHTLRLVAREAANLREATRAARETKMSDVPLSWRVLPETPKSEVEFLGIERREVLSPVSGGVRVEWLGRPVTIRVPYSVGSVATSVDRPAAYWVPASWRQVIEKLDLHGIRYERISAPREVEVTMYRLGEPEYGRAQFEGHVRVTAPAKSERRRERFPANSVRVPTDQPLGTLAVLLLEPSSPDSLFQWGFLNSILAPTEYVENYIMEPMAERMLAEDPKLAAEFHQKVESDPEFRGNAQARLQWLYERTPFYDLRARLYPIGREE
jgi:Zinc carboxypeptidase